MTAIGHLLAVGFDGHRFDGLDVLTWQTAEGHGIR